MESSKIDLIIQYSLLVAGEEDEFFDRQLGPIHLIKYVYLADLAYADRNQGQTFTGIIWQFYKFGPWSQNVHERIEPALIELKANKKTFPSKFDDKDDWVRWQLRDDDLLDNIDRQLPVSITALLRRDIHRFGNDTASLLNHVYQTPPMLSAAPSECLDFSQLNQASRKTVSSSPLKYEELSTTKKKKFKKRIQELRKKNAKRTSADRRTTQLINPVTSPRYDDVYYEGLNWLDSLAGPPLKEGELEATFSDYVWKSSTRKGEDVS